ncbi:MAG TPA: hypothetical protein VGG35_04520 [Streptosporangiaceae bacterium]|jgi:hypothetical protein
MNIHDELSDNEVLRAASDSLSAMPVAGPPDVEAIMARGRAHRARRLSAVAGLSVAGVAAGTALALGLTGALGPARTTGTIRTAAFTLVSNTNGTATLTLNPVQLFDPGQLQSDLAKYGIPAKVTSGSYCTSDPEPAGFSQVVSLPGPGTSQGTSRQTLTITIDPAAMPDGTELSFGNFQLTTGELAGEQQADMDLIDASSYTCTSTPPTLGPDTPGFGVLRGGQADGRH